LFFRSILATQSANGEVYIHSLTNILGKWDPTFAVSKILRDYFKKNAWLNPNYSSDCKCLKTQMKEYTRRKHLLFTVALCWCPVVWTCNKCLINQNPDNMYYTSYFINFASCNHGKFMLCSASKSGYLFLWNLSYHKRDPAQHELNISCIFETGIYWPVSIAWSQLSTKDG